MKKAIVSVTNDLSTDQRVHKVCEFLTDQGIAVTLVGRIQKNSMPLVKRNYQTKRLKLWKEKGSLFYAFYNIRLFFFLMFHKADLLVANDLDTLLANYLVSKIKGIPIVYDSHEYYCGVPELLNRPKVKAIWHGIEKRIFPKLRHIYTVNDSIANLYKEEYKVDIKVVRNVPVYKETNSLKTRKELGLPEEIPLIIFQGAGINIDRGAEEAVMAMKWVKDAVLMVIGSGDVIEKLKETSNKPELKDRIIFIPKLPFNDLKQYTMQAEIGLTLDKDTSINYRFSLPNKLFDYIHAGIAVLGSKVVEVKKIIDNYQVGELIENHEPKHIADKINEMLANKEQLKTYKKNSIEASKQLNWQNEQEELKKIYAFIIDA